MATLFLPGRMNRLISIEKPAKIKDSHGALVDTWVTHANTLAAIEHISNNQYRMKMRYHGGVTTQMRVRRPDGELYTIIAEVTPGENRQFLMLICENQVRC